LRGFAARQFARRRLVVSVAGDIDAGALKTLLDATFGGLPAGQPQPDPALTAPQTGAIKVIQRDIGQTVMMFGMPGLLRQDPDFIAAYVMNHVLGGGGFTSRLTSEIREKRGLAYSVYSYLAPLDEAGLFMGGVATQNQRANETVALIAREFARLRDTGITQQELDDAKTYLTGSFALRFDTNAKISGQLLELQLDHLGIDYLNIRNGLIQAVSLADIERTAKRLLAPEAMLLVAVGKPQGIQPEQ